MRSLFALIAIAPLLAACATTPKPVTGTAPPQTSRTPPPPQQSRPSPSAAGFRAPRVMSVPGLEDVKGKSATALANMFGPPRLSVTEGDAQKLQFAGASCVLDVYLYPLTPGAAPSATYVNARRPSDGLDVDRAACARALKR